MDKSNPNNRERYIVLYADDYDCDVWEKYCDALCVEHDAIVIRVNFDKSDVVSDLDN